jgi:predicted ATPase
MAFNGDVSRDLAAQFLALAEKQRATGSLMIGHRVMGMSLLYSGDIVESRVHYDRAVALYDSAEHRSLATRFAVDSGAANLLSRSQALWLLGYPEAALADTDHAVKNARETGHAATLMYVLNFTSSLHIFCGNYAEATAQLDEVFALADEKGALIWKAFGTVFQGWVLALTGKAPHAVQLIGSAMTALRSTGTTLLMPMDLSILAKAHAALSQYGDAWRCVREAMTAVEASKERWAQAEINRIAGVIALKSPQPDAAKAKMYFENALAVARQQQAKSWELRAAMSMARLWRDQGKVQEARELLNPVYGWFTEGSTRAI